MNSLTPYVMKKLNHTQWREKRAEYNKLKVRIDEQHQQIGSCTSPEQFKGLYRELYRLKGESQKLGKQLWPKKDPWPEVRFLAGVLLGLIIGAWFFF